MTFEDLLWIAEALGGDAFCLPPPQAPAGEAQGGPGPELARRANISEATAAEWLRSATEQGRVSASNGPHRFLLVTQPETLWVLRTPSNTTETLAELSHELKNAFGSILGWVSAARQADGPDNPRRVQRALGSIESTTRAAEGTVRHFLRSAQGQEPELDTVSLGTLLQNIVRLLEPSFQAKGLRLRFRQRVDARLAASEPVLFSMFWNILENAVAASPNNAELTVEIERQGDTTLQVAVRDQGPGISPEEQQKIFERYYTTKRHGTGLGLSLVKSAVDSLGGTLAIESELGRGTTVSVLLNASLTETVPPKKSSGTILRTASVEAGGGAFAGLRVLIVENDASMRDLLTTSLELTGAHVCALRHYIENEHTDESFDLALVDYRLDDQAGDAVADQLRKRAQVPKIAFLSGSEAPADLALGSSIWIRKPFTIDALLTRLREFCADLGNEAPGQQR